MKAPISHYDIAIVGGGFSGTVLSIQLLKCSPAGTSIAVINRAGRPGRGVAYGTECEDHLLNVGAGKMSAFPQDPDHFLNWLRRTLGRCIKPEEFVPRRLYGEYLENTLNRTLKEFPNAAFSWIEGDAISIAIKSHRPCLELATGVEIEARVVVLATGNAPPIDPPQLRTMTNGFYIPYVWAKDALDGFPPRSKVLILGSGLTAIDQVLTLRAQRFQGTIFMLSRHGRLPAVHSPSDAWASDWASELPYSIRSIFFLVRQQIKAADSKGVDWRAVIDSLRPSVSHIWQTLPAAERRRFLRHLRSHWEVARHRVPQETHDLLMGLKDSGSLQIVTGRLLRAVERDDGVDVTVYERKVQRERLLSVDRIINCTGSGTSTRVQDKLVLSLLEIGQATLDPLKIGIITDSVGSVIGASGTPSNCIFTIGPIRKASLWETTAVPEIRMQAIQLARHILIQLENAGPYATR